MGRINKTKTMFREHIATSKIPTKCKKRTTRDEINSFVHYLNFCPKPTCIYCS